MCLYDKCRVEPGTALDQREPKSECDTDGMSPRLRELLPLCQGDSTPCEQQHFFSLSSGYRAWQLRALGNGTAAALGHVGGTLWPDMGVDNPGSKP